MVGQIIINDKKSYDDFGFTIKDIEIGIPSPNIMTETIPYKSGFYDYSNINGEAVYTSRKIRVVFESSEEEDTEKTNFKYFKLVNFLLAMPMGKLRVSWVEGFFMARVQSISDISLMMVENIVEVEFLCQPFRTKEEFEGNDIWDTFNFLEDVAQRVKFKVIRNKSIVLINTSICKANPKIISSSDMTIKYRNREIIVKSGVNINILRLDRGENSIELIGDGEIEFKWNREWI